MTVGWAARVSGAKQVPVMSTLRFAHLTLPPLSRCYSVQLQQKTPRENLHHHQHHHHPSPIIIINLSTAQHRADETQVAEAKSMQMLTAQIHQVGICLVSAVCMHDSQACL